MRSPTSPQPPEGVKQKANVSKDVPPCTRLRMRRGSSMSDLDKLAQAPPSRPGEVNHGEPAAVREPRRVSAPQPLFVQVVVGEQPYQREGSVLVLGTGQSVVAPSVRIRSAETPGCHSRPPLPPPPRLLNLTLKVSTLTRPSGSIGDLMNLKRFGSSQWSVRSDTLIAQTVPPVHGHAATVAYPDALQAAPAGGGRRGGGDAGSSDRGAAYPEAVQADQEAEDQPAVEMPGDHV
ncbi:hypothetical protein NQ317_009445 [Molorchus minor]|uniref:Uncharacterized protein n=1 Tax=Molorchus minor TaxID=1323400 RepID=A0ABQ9JVI5_9CUCU|nr:hypothetical protein NQ317_009445 [Molorchus minor]